MCPFVFTIKTEYKYAQVYNMQGILCGPRELEVRCNLFPDNIAKQTPKPGCTFIVYFCLELMHSN